MLSWDALDPLPFTCEGAVTTAFLAIPKTDLRAAARYVCELPYGRNSDPDALLIVLTERRGTCSTKHALLRRLATEQGFELVLVLGIYEMTERNTPGVGAVLRRHGLTGLPEAHCYLRTGGRRLDITKARSDCRREPIEHFFHEEEIDAAQITHYKTACHKKFLEKSIAERGALNGLSLEQVWAIREECIARLRQ